MNAPAFPMPNGVIPVEFQTRFEAQRAAFLEAPCSSHAERMVDLDALARLVKDHRPAILAAIDADYGHRSEFETLFGEIFPLVDAIRDARRRLKSWMRPEQRHVDLLTFPGARNKVIAQPVGVVGVIVPWN